MGQALEGNGVELEVNVTLESGTLSVRQNGGATSCYLEYKHNHNKSKQIIKSYSHRK